MSATAYDDDDGGGLAAVTAGKEVKVWRSSSLTSSCRHAEGSWRRLAPTVLPLVPSETVDSGSSDESEEEEGGGGNARRPSQADSDIGGKESGWRCTIL